MGATKALGIGRRPRVRRARPPRIVARRGLAWSVSAPWAANEAVTTPDLSAVIQGIVDRAGWSPMNAVAIVVRGTGSRTVFAFDAGAGVAPALEVVYAEPGNSRDYPVCMPYDGSNTKSPANLNPNYTGVTPTDQDLQNDCSVRVATTLTDLARACNYATVCTCNYKPGSTVLAKACTDTCATNELASDCSNLDPNLGNTQATNVTGDAPVCTVHRRRLVRADVQLERRARRHGGPAGGVLATDASGNQATTTCEVLVQR